MKILITLLASAACTLSAHAESTVSSRIPAKIHVIQNFEGWNDVLIRFSGVLRNSCYSKGETSVRVENDQVMIDNEIKFEAGQPCLAVLSPYSGKIAVRDLKEGTYDVLVKDKYGTYQEMTSFQTE